MLVLLCENGLKTVTRLTFVMVRGLVPFSLHHEFNNCLLHHDFNCGSI